MHNAPSQWKLFKMVQPLNPGLEETVTLMPGRPSLNLPPSSPIFLDFSRFPPDFWLCSLGENGAKNGGNGKKWVESAIEGLQKKALMRRTWGVVVAAAPGRKKKCLCKTLSVFLPHNCRKTSPAAPDNDFITWTRMFAEPPSPPLRFCSR